MNWPDAEAAIRSLIETEWALTPYAATMPLAWEAETDVAEEQFVFVTIEGTFGDKTIYGGPGKRSSIEAGLIFYHAFVPTGTGKQLALSAVNAMTGILELRVVQSDIRIEGANPPSPIEMSPDRDLPRSQPGGMYFRCSGSVPFIVIGTI
jgi:hypothetical protein